MSVGERTLIEDRVLFWTWPRHGGTLETLRGYATSVGVLCRIYTKFPDSVGLSEDISPLKSLDTLVDTFHALNTASSNKKQDPPPLDHTLRDAIQLYDTQSQLNIYDKLAEVRRTDAELPFLVIGLNKI
jgi:hypothetical protein